MMTQASKNAALSNHWQQHIEAWQVSGLSQAAFCEQHKLIYHRFGYWCRKLKEPDGSKGNNGPAFVRVIRQDCTKPPGLSVRFPNGIELCGVDEDNLALVNQLLQQWS